MVRFWLLVLCFFNFIYSPSKGSNQNENSAKVIATSGDIIIGGLCPLHYPSVQLKQDQKLNEHSCRQGVFNPRGLQLAEAILYAIDQINNNPELLPGVKIGAEIRDTCNSVDHAIRETLQFPFVRQVYSHNVESAPNCGFAELSSLNQSSTRTTVAIVGAAYSGITMAVTSLAGLFYIPVVSYASTSRLLEDRSRFKYFLRTVPSDTLQAEAMVGIIKEFKWNFVSTIASDTEYGRSGIDAFRTTVNKLNYSICIAVNALFTTRTDKSTLRKIIQELREHPKARVIVLFAELNDADYFIQTAKEENLTGKIWIGSDAYSKSYDILKGNEEFLEQWISTSPEEKEYRPFKDYYLNITTERKARNPWLLKYGGLLAKDFNSSNKIDFSVYTTTVIDAVYAVAHGLHALYNCSKTSCERSNTTIDHSRLYEFIKNVTFSSPTGNRVGFDAKGSAGSRYGISYVKNRTNRGNSSFGVLGRWDLTNGFTFSPEYSHTNNPLLKRNLSSTCSVECPLGYQKQPHTNYPKCCWECFRCPGNSMTNNSGMTSCITCPQGTRVNQEKSACDVIAATVVVMTTGGMAVMGLYSVGMVAVLGTLVMFIRNNNSPVVRASSKELSYIILCGIALNLTNSFALILQPTATLCQLRPFFSSIAIAMVLGSLLSKTNTISRIFSLKTMRTGTPHFMSKKWQLTFVCVCVLLGNIVAAVWVILSPFKVVTVPHDQGQVTIECGSKSSKAGFATWVTYHAGLMILCTYQAFLVRKVPANYNEAKFIGFTMVTICLSAVVYVPTYYGTRGVYRIILTSSLYLFCSYSSLFCLFGPKLYIIVFRPEKNQPLKPRESRTAGMPGRLDRSLPTADDHNASSNSDHSLATNNKALSFTSLAINHDSLQ